MDKFLEGFKTWSPIIVPLLTPILGGGLLRYYLELRQAKREKAAAELITWSKHSLRIEPITLPRIRVAMLSAER
jgi:hypothetical protein